MRDIVTCAFTINHCLDDQALCVCKCVCSPAHWQCCHAGCCFDSLTLWCCCCKEHQIPESLQHSHQSDTPAHNYQTDTHYITYRKSCARAMSEINVHLKMKQHSQHFKLIKCDCEIEYSAGIIVLFWLIHLIFVLISSWNVTCLHGIQPQLFTIKPVTFVRKKQTRTHVIFMRFMIFMRNPNAVNNGHLSKKFFSKQTKTRCIFHWHTHFPLV